MRDGTHSRCFKATDAAKARTWAAVRTLRDATSGTGLREDLIAHYTRCFAVEPMREFMKDNGFNSEAYVEKKGKQLAALEHALGEFLRAKLTGFTADLYGDLLELTQRWANERRWELLVRYLGFPFWDVLLYPIQALSDVGERDHVEIVRISPRDTHRIPVPTTNGQQNKLKGAEAHHFGAFLSRSGREKDYLWGRLDGAERLISILLKDATDADQDRWCKEGFRAILDEDAKAVPHASDLVGHVSALIA